MATNLFSMRNKYHLTMIILGLIANYYFFCTKSFSKEASFSGMASINYSLPEKDLELGKQALSNRVYDLALKHLHQAQKELTKTTNNEALKIELKLYLAEAFIGKEQYEKALKLLTELKTQFYKKQDSASAHFYYLLSKTQFESGQNKLALANIENCIRILQTSISDSNRLQLAEAYTLLANIFCQNSYFEEAKNNFSKALEILETYPSSDRLEYAEALLGISKAEKGLNHKTDSNLFAEKALALKNDAVFLDKTSNEKGLVKFIWQEGQYGSRQITDPNYPLKYVVINGLRIATTLIRSQKHLCVLISLANCSAKPMQVSVGQVSLEKLFPGKSFLKYCDPAFIDSVLEQNCISDLTWRRRVLNHIEKSRRIPGYLKNNLLDPDDFFGNNIFGLYGAWDNNIRDLPPIVSQEEYYYSKKLAPPDTELLEFMRGSESSIHPTFIEPGGARTGELFFLRERFEKILIRIRIGNCEIQFPFEYLPGH